MFKPSKKHLEELKKAILLSEDQTEDWKGIMEGTSRVNSGEEGLKGNPGQVLINYEEDESLLKRSVDDKNFIYELKGNGKRKKLLDFLLKEKRYIQAEDLKNELECPSTASVAKLAQTLSDKARVSLHLNKIKLIVGRRGFGYRINPQIIIEKE